jgi:CHAT domain-containing protein
VQILSDVPFAALRKLDSPVGEGYLIQSHTISVTPSLRVLQDCDHKWKELDQNTYPGTIVAVAEPYFYENKGNGNKVPLITPMGKEVNFIEEEFGEKYVKKLVGPAATPSEVLKWAKYPSDHQVKQVVFHIAAHGIRQDDSQEVKMGAIVLARNGKLGIYGLLVITNADILTHSCMHIVRC